MDKLKQELISPYGGSLINLVAPSNEKPSLLDMAKGYSSIQLSTRNLCDLELLAVGGFSPISRFMNRSDYESVISEMRLSNGVLFPIPITLTINENELPYNQEWITLRDSQNNIIAIMRIEDVFQWNPYIEANSVTGTTDKKHPLVSEMGSWKQLCVSGELKVLNLPFHYDFVELRKSPAQVRDALLLMGNEKVVAFQTRNPIHRAHEELTKRAADFVGGRLLIHPVVGMTKPDDIDHYTRVRIYKAVVEKYYDSAKTILSLLPLAMRMAGPKEAILHAIIRRNYGATHFIVGRDHAGPGADSNGKPFYKPYDAQDKLAQYASEIGVQPVLFDELVYLTDEKRYEEKGKIFLGTKISSISGTQARDEYLSKGKILPEWFTRRETAEILSSVYPPYNKQGVCLWFTGLSGAGKSTISQILSVMLMEYGKQITILDGDIVRTHLSKGLGFSKEDRDTNILRIGFVASEIVKHRGTVICAAISPYRDTRNSVRKMVGGSNFIEIYVNTPIDICEQRDVKGMYARARSGEIKGFTGVDDPYEPPEFPEIVLETAIASPEENARYIINYLIEKGFV